jgi:hypothetical protein
MKKSKSIECARTERVDDGCNVVQPKKKKTEDELMIHGFAI